MPGIFDKHGLIKTLVPVLILFVAITLSACAGGDRAGDNGTGDAPQTEQPGNTGSDEPGGEQQPGPGTPNSPGGGDTKPNVVQSLFRGSPSRTGVYDAPGPGDAAALLWKFKTGDEVYSSPVEHEGIVYFGSREGTFYALDAATGEQKWRFWTRRAIYASPALAGDTVYAGGYDGIFYAIDARTGELKWQYATGNRINSSATIAGKRAYFGSDDGYLYALGPGVDK